MLQPLDEGGAMVAVKGLAGQLHSASGYRDIVSKKCPDLRPRW
jgi:hypothetical protein